MGDVRAAAELVVVGSRESGCAHIWNAYGQCQWCHRERFELAAGIVARAWLAEHPADDGEAVTDWRPIETAPKDGTHILMWRETQVGASVSESWWRTDGQFGDGWGGHGWMYSTWQQPTNWMPLPEPPVG